MNRLGCDVHCRVRCLFVTSCDRHSACYEQLPTCPAHCCQLLRPRFEIYFLSNDCLKTLVTQTCSLPILTVLLIIEMLVSSRNIYKYFLLHLIRYIIIFLGSGIFFINPHLYYDIISIYYKKYWFKDLNRFYWPKIIIEIQNTQNM